MNGKIHVRDLHTRDVCILPCRKEKKYFLYDCFARPGQKGESLDGVLP